MEEEVDAEISIYQVNTVIFLCHLYNYFITIISKSATKLESLNVTTRTIAINALPQQATVTRVKGKL